MHERSLVSVNVEPRSTSRLRSAKKEKKGKAVYFVEVLLK